jgi:hypothetical protein
MLAGLARVQVTATRLTVEVNGTSLDGCELELFGVTGRASQLVSSPGEVTFSLDRGLPEHAWLWLKIGTRWLDYRSIDPGSGWTWDLARAGVDIAVPSDPQANVEALLAPAREPAGRSAGPASRGPGPGVPEPIGGQQASSAVAALSGAHGGETDHGLVSLASAP